MEGVTILLNGSRNMKLEGFLITFEPEISFFLSTLKI